MEKTLLRPLFRKKYLDSIKPKKLKIGGLANIKKFQEGGEVQEDSINDNMIFSPEQERAIMGMQLASSLLGGVRKPGQSLFAGAVGDIAKGVTSLPATAVQLAKIRPKKKKSFRTMTKEEVKAKGLPPGTVAQIEESTGEFQIKSKPTEGQMKELRENKKVLGVLNSADRLYNKLGKPVGPGSIPSRVAYTIGRLAGTQSAKDYAKMTAQLEQTKSFFLKAISGAQVSEQEFKRVESFMPTTGDTVVSFDAKMEALKEYSNTAIALATDAGMDMELAFQVMDAKGITENISNKYKQAVTYKKEGDAIDISMN